MKKIIVSTLKDLASDKPLFRLCISIMVISVIAVVLLAVRLSATELQIATRFSAFGETQYYRNQWYYLLTFIVFILSIAGAHIALIAKMIQRDMRQYAVLFGSITLLMIVVISLIAHAVFSVAYLS